MDFSIVPINKVFKIYQGQERIADLNKRNRVNRVQGQKDRVSISSAARQALQKNPKGDAPPVAPKPAQVPAAKTTAAEQDFVPGI
jgi:hypothetical protein